MIPTIVECFQLIDQYKMLPNIRAHSILVARVAWLIGKGLADKGQTTPARVASSETRAGIACETGYQKLIYAVSGDKPTA